MSELDLLEPHRVDEGTSVFIPIHYPPTAFFRPHLDPINYFHLYIPMF